MSTTTEQVTNTTENVEVVDTAEPSTRLDFERISNLSRRLVLAGLGAYGRSFDNLAGTFKTAAERRNRLFEELVVRGEKMEEDARSGLSGVREEAEERFQEARSTASKTVEKINLPKRLFGLVDNLERTVDSLEARAH